MDIQFDNNKDNKNLYHICWLVKTRFNTAKITTYILPDRKFSRNMSAYFSKIKYRFS